jgi:hypothetical protein
MYIWIYVVADCNLIHCIISGLNTQHQWPLSLLLLFSVSSVEGPVFNITRVNRLHMGAYLCIASNGVPPTVSKRIMLIVHCTFCYKSLDVPFFRLSRWTCSYISSFYTNVVCCHEGKHLFYWFVLVKKLHKVPYFRVLSSFSYVMPVNRGPRPAFCRISAAGMENQLISRTEMYEMRLDRHWSKYRVAGLTGKNVFW